MVVAWGLMGQKWKWVLAGGFCHGPEERKWCGAESSVVAEEILLPEMGTKPQKTQFHRQQVLGILPFGMH